MVMSCCFLRSLSRLAAALPALALPSDFDSARPAPLPSARASARAALSPLSWPLAPPPFDGAAALSTEAALPRAGAWSACPPDLCALWSAFSLRSREAGDGADLLSCFAADLLEDLLLTADLSAPEGP